MFRFRSAPAPLSLTIAALLTACGGGGGGGSSGGSDGGTNPPLVTPALSFTPATVSASIPAGTSQTLSVIGAVARPSDFSGATVFPSIVDSNGVLLPNAQLVRDSDSQYHAVLQSAPTLAAGNYKGSFSVRLCRDSGCASQFPGSPVALPYELTVTPAGVAPFSAVSVMPLTATGQAGGTAPASATVSITAAGRGWTASNGGATWLKLSAASGNGNGTLSVSYDLTGLAQGSYSTKLTISASDGQSAVLPVTLTVAPPGIVLGANSVDFSAVNGAPVPSQVVKIDAGGSTAWSASSNTGWLSVSPASGTTPGTIVLNVNPAVGRLASGNYQGSATIQPANAVARLLPVTLKLTPATLQASTTSLVLGGPYGRDFSTNGDLKFSLNTATNSWSWGINNVPTWVTASATTGSVNQAGASISFRPYPALAKVGVNSQLLAGFSVVNGDLITTSILLSLNKDLHKLLPSDPAVALVATPTWRRLTRTITVSDNYGSFAGMRATSDQPWLALSINNNQLTMTADPAGMTANTLNTANITLYPNDGDAAAPEPVRVALWVGAAAPTAATRTALSYANVAADPLRPYIYVHNGGAYVDVYNIYSGAKEATIAGLGAVLGDMAVTPNGDTLYVVDASNSRLTALDLNARNIARQLPLAVAATTATRLKIIRPNGVELAVLSDGQVYLTASGARLPNLPLSSGGTLGASSDGTRVVQQDEGSGAVRHTSVSVDYTALNNGTLYAAKLAPASHTSPSTQGQDVFVGSDASRVYSAAASLKSCTVLNAADLGILSYLAIGDAVANNVKVGADGRIYCGGAAKAGSSDIYQFSSAGAVLQRYKLSTTGRQLLPRQMAVSGDGLMLIAITDDGIVTFVPVGP